MIAEKMKAVQGRDIVRMATEKPMSEAAEGKEAESHLVPGSKPPNPEVGAEAARRRFTAEYKLRIVKQAAACMEPGKLGELLRREGPYASNLKMWQRQSDEGVLSGSKAQEAGGVRKPTAIPSLKTMKSFAGRTSV